MRLRGLLAEDGVRQLPPPRLWDVLVGRRALGALSAAGAHAAPLRAHVLVVRQGALPAEDLGADVGLTQGGGEANAHTCTYTHAHLHRAPATWTSAAAADAAAAAAAAAAACTNYSCSYGYDYHYYCYCCCC